MQFTHWHMDRLRRGLNNYRIEHARDGRLLPWKVVIDRLLMSAKTHHQYAEDGTEPGFKEESLRRFAVGKSVLMPDKLEDLRRFLIEKRLLGPTELEDGPTEMRSLLVLASHLANDGEPVRRELERIGSVHRSVRRVESVSMYIDLHKTLDENGPFLRVEEQLTVEEAITPERRTHFAKDQVGSNINRKERRVGYGFLSTPANQFHVFLTGAAPDDRVTYLEMSPRREDSRYTDMHLLRTGDFGKESLGVVKGRDQQEQYYWGGLLQFIPGWRL